MKNADPLPDLDALVQQAKPEELQAFFRPYAAGSSASYPNWDEARQSPPPGGLPAEKGWLLTKLIRRRSYRPLPFFDAGGTPFQYSVPEAAFELLHRIDRETLGANPAFEPINTPQTRATYLQKSLIEEAIRSGQLDGGSTPRRAAKDLILAGREPEDVGQRKIFNNHAALEKVREWCTQPLTPARVLELHAILTTGTLEDAEGVGQLRQGGGRDSASDKTGRPPHRAPDAAQLPARLDAICDFANGDQTGEFLHPVVRAALVMFAVMHDEPFADGNGRMARALFYWVMAREGYSLAEFVSTSRVFRKARAQYLRAFHDTMVDENDVTYFVLYHLRIFTRAIRELQEYLERKSAEIRDVELRLAQSANSGADVNRRQLDALANALKEPNALYTIEAHRRAHDTAYATARSDLLILAKLGLLEHQKRGRSFVFVPPADLRSRLPLATVAT